MGYMRVSFYLPIKYPKLQTNFCHWYAGENTSAPSYNLKLSCLDLIIERFERLIKESSLAILVQLEYMSTYRAGENI